MGNRNWEQLYKLHDKVKPQKEKFKTLTAEIEKLKTSFEEIEIKDSGKDSPALTPSTFKKWF